MKLPPILFFCIVFLISRLWAETPVASVIEATDATALQSAIGKTIVVRGTVDRVEATKTNINKVYFKETNFFVYISSKDMAAHQDWNLESWVGKEMFARGLVKKYYKQLDLVVTHPNQLSASVAALAAEPAAPATPDNPTKPEAATVGFAVKLPAASLTQWRFKVEGAKSKQTYQLMSERMEARWEKLSTRSTSTSRLRFETSSFSATKNREPSNRAVELITARHGGNWPTGNVVRFKRGNDASDAGWPSALTTAVLLESTIRGVELPAGMMVAGELNGDGSLTGGHNELIHALRSPLLADSVVLVSGTAQSVLEDFLLEGQAGRLIEVPIFAANTLDEAMVVVQCLADPAFKNSMAKMMGWREILSTRGVSAFRQPELRAALTDLIRIFPQLLNAKVLLAALDAKSQTAPTLSVNGTAHRLFVLHEECEQNLVVFTSDTPESRKKLKDVTERFAALKPRCHQRYKSFVAGLETLLDALKDASRHDPKDTNPRAKKAKAALEDAITACAADAVVVDGEIGMVRP